MCCVENLPCKLHSDLEKYINVYTEVDVGIFVGMMSCGLYKTFSAYQYYIKFYIWDMDTCICITVPAEDTLSIVYRFAF